ncbi:hypothetical protein NDN08_007674 [Rhodosorus marinus]|uniref:C2H2-type domain-containing protein n=1 Tax=Rhodosorus marinus TaxID=101924 RepID=A0AAV8UY86_9RHOD|nr:hypothetical protein NDN08_007674 [Rhodosorus marinus]
MIYVEDLNLSGPFREAGELLWDEPSIASWLTGETDGKLRSDMFRLAVVPFDFLRIEQGPELGLRETVEFRRSIMVVSHIAGNLAFGLVLKLDGKELRQDRVVVHSGPNGDVIAFASNSDSDGALTLRTSLLLRSEGYKKAYVFTAKAPAGSRTFSGTRNIMLDPDCDFCKIRGEPCHCSAALKERSFVTSIVDNAALANPWINCKLALEQMVGNMWMISGNGDYAVRANLDCSERIAHPRVQTILGLASSWVSANRFDSLSMTNQNYNKRALTDGKEYLQTMRAKKSRFKSNFICTECSSTFKSRYHLERHVKAVHQRRKDFACKHCDKTYSQRSHLKLHTANVHEGNAKIVCEYCQYEFAWRTNYLKHVRKNHPEADL